MHRLKLGFKNLPIQRKIGVAIQMTCASALAVAAAAIFVAQLITFRQAFTRDLEAIGSILGNNSTAAISFKDRKAAEEILGAVSAKSHILQATLRLPDESVFAEYKASGFSGASVAPKGDGFHFFGPWLVLNRPVLLAGERIATLRLVSNYQNEYRRSFRLYAAILAGVLIASILLTLLLSQRVERLISAPILDLAQTAQEVARRKDYSLRVAKRSEDEVGQLTASFNSMLAKIQNDDATLRESHQVLERQIEERKKAEEALEKVNKQLLVTSRQAGMAEVATGVLHNVGNVLNSVNVSLTVIRDQLQQSEVSSLLKLSALLQSHAADQAQFLTTHPKGQAIPGFVVQLAEQLGQEHERLNEEHNLLVRNVEHIKEIVAMQQNYASVSGIRETISIADLVEDALRLHTAGLQRHGVQIQRDFASVPPINIDKHKVLQVLVNLIHNAKYALDASGRADRQLSVAICLNGDNRLRITVADNGIGIPPENLTRIFSLGFTTRKGGHGFGLHSGANAAKEMGGELRAHSDGPGKGAAFTLELPLSSEKVRS
ncbi:MAG TPA: ATP-binding protein [Verrucomicrobiae bacterium]|nr:ATP-binding protein [Verrucomicrobiae bacterium]